jgi:FixJ family two-component response regulator
LRPTLPTILTSGFGDTMNQEERASLSPSAFIQKPYSQAELADLVQYLLRSPADDIPQTP